MKCLGLVTVIIMSFFYKLNALHYLKDTLFIS